MKKMLVMLVSLAGCVGHEVTEPATYDPRPVDTTYRVTVTGLYDTDCSAIFNFTEGSTTVDMMRRPDGKLIMSSPSAYLPFYGPVEGIESHDGNISERLENPANQPDYFRAIEVEGVLTPDKIDLTIAVESAEPYRDESAICRRAVRVVGVVWPVDAGSEKAGATSPGSGRAAPSATVTASRNDRGSSMRAS